MTEETNKECCSANKGECCSVKEECCSVEGERSVSKDALMIAGAILLGSLIVAAAVFFVNSKVSSTAVVATDDTKQPTAAQPSKTEVTMDQVKALFSDSKNIVLGKKDSKVLFVEFSDPSCPYCSIAAGKNPNLNKQAGPQFKMVADGGTYIPPVPEMRKLVDAGKAAFVWMYANGHGNGELGTQASYCAHEKGKFWEVHDLLMSEAGYNLMNDTVKNDVSKAGQLADFLKSAVKPSDMKACLESGKYASRITEDMAVAQQFGFAGTPSFFVNTKNFAGAYSFKDIQSTVDQFLK